MQVSLQKNKNKSNRYVHDLVALAFCKGYKSEKEVNHIDKNRKNNIFTNLEWLTHQQNNMYSLAKSISQYKNDVFIAKYRSLKEAMEKTKIYDSNICNVVNTKYTAGGYTWKYE